MRKIAIILARSGSKGLKNKNILLLNGKHMIGWTIEAALQSKIFERIIVSTDSTEYKMISESYGAEVIMRDEDLASDDATSFDVIEHLLKDDIEDVYDYFVLLQPTSPTRDSQDICDACYLFENNFNDFDFLVSVVETNHSPELVKHIQDGSMKEFNSDFASYRRQNDKYYSPNGGIFIGKPNEYLSQKHFFGAKSLAFKMDKLHSIDVDDWIDFKTAEVIMKEIF